MEFLCLKLCMFKLEELLWLLVVINKCLISLSILDARNAMEVDTTKKRENHARNVFVKNAEDQDGIPRRISLAKK